MLFYKTSKFFRQRSSRLRGNVKAEVDLSNWDVKNVVKEVTSVDK